MSEAGSRRVAVHLPNLSKYYQDHINLKLGQIVDAAYLPCDLRKKNLEKLAESMHVRGYHYELCSLTVLFSADLPSNASPGCTPLDKFEG